MGKILSVKLAKDIHRIGVRACAGKVICALAAALLLTPFSLAGQKSPSPSKANPAGSFDTPVKTVKKVHKTLTCYYYPHLLVKEKKYAPNGLGSDWLSILRSQDKLPACRLSHEAGERVVHYPEWEGDFWGVKDNLVFFMCSEYEQGDCSFVVYDSTTGKRLFLGDVAVSYKEGGLLMQVFSTEAGVVARYLAAAHAGCDLYAKGTDCWKKVKAKFSLKSDRKPVCRGYPAVYKEFKVDRDESMIGYPVEVTLSPHPAIKTVAGPIRCWSTF